MEPVRVFSPQSSLALVDRSGMSCGNAWSGRAASRLSPQLLGTELGTLVLTGFGERLRLVDTPIAKTLRGIRRWRSPKLTHC